MKINTNPIGNYNPYSVRNIKASPTDKLQNKGTAKLESPAENITPEEKTFFAKMYPENQSEIKNYHFYKRNGEMSGVNVGQILDKRG